MKIDGVELRHIQIPLIEPFETAFGTEHLRQALIIRVDAGGVSAWGECAAVEFPGYSYETAGTAWHILEAFVIPMILQFDLTTIEAYRELISPIKGHPMAKAGMEMALWDLEGKLRGKSVSQLLGGKRKKVQVGVSVGIKDSAESLIQAIEGYLQQGYRRIKIKIKPGRDLKELELIRKEFPNIPLQVDANSSYSIADARIFQTMDDFQLLMIEQPFAEDDLIDHSRLQAKVRTAICLDESISNLRHAEQAIEIDACRIINIKSGRVGGLYEARSIAQHCLQTDIPVWCGGMLETGIGRAANLALASLDGFDFPADISASSRYYKKDIALPLFKLNQNSTIDVPDGLGLGVEIQNQRLDEITLRKVRYDGSR